MNFWEIVCFELEFQGMTRKELAFKSDIPLMTINKGIARKSIPTVYNAYKIAKALDVSLEYLVTGSRYSSNKRLIHEDQYEQIHLYKKYSSIIAEIDSLSPQKQSQLREIIRNIKSFADLR